MSGTIKTDMISDGASPWLRYGKLPDGSGRSVLGGTPGVSESKVTSASAGPKPAPSSSDTISTISICGLAVLELSVAGTPVWALGDAIGLSSRTSTVDVAVSRSFGREEGVGLAGGDEGIVSSVRGAEFRRLSVTRGEGPVD